MLWSCNLACRWREGRSTAWTGGGGLSGGGEISDAVRGAFERVWVPGQQAGVVVALRRLLRVFIDYLCRDTLERTLLGLGRVGVFDAGLGLSVDEGGDGCEL